MGEVWGYCKELVKGWYLLSHDACLDDNLVYSVNSSLFHVRIIIIIA